MRGAIVAYFIYFVVWVLCSFLNPWAELVFFYIPIYIWLTSFLLPLGLCFYLLGKFVFFSESYTPLINPSSKLDRNHDFFLGSNSSILLLATTFVATYLSGSSFLAGPSMALKVGFPWLLLASIQIPALFLAIGFLGEKFIKLKDHIPSLTVIDILNKRYPSRSLSFFFSFFFLISLVLALVIQLMAGSKLLSGIFGFSYNLSLLVFLLFISTYVLLGGFSHILRMDAFQMVGIAGFLIFYAFIIFIKGENFSLWESLSQKEDSYFSISGGGVFSWEYLISLWVLLGVGLLGTPAITSRLLSLEKKKDLVAISLLATFFLSFFVVGIHLMPILSSGALGGEITTGDTAWIKLIGRMLGRQAEVLFTLVPIMATISTADTLLLIIISLFWSKIPSLKEERKKRIIFKKKMILILIISFLIYFLALYPPPFLVWLNLFSLALSEVLFFVPLFFGLIYFKGNNKGVWASWIVGLSSFILWQVIFKGSTLFFHPILISLILASLAYFLVSALTLDSRKEEQSQTFFKDILK